MDSTRRGSDSGQCGTYSVGAARHSEYVVADDNVTRPPVPSEQFHPQVSHPLQRSSSRERDMCQSPVQTERHLARVVHHKPTALHSAKHISDAEVRFKKAPTYFDKPLHFSNSNSAIYEIQLVIFDQI
jgi:hypothetical protein